jgi:hypothetical protein
MRPQFRWIVIGVAVTLIAGGIGIGYLITRTERNMGPAIDRVSDLELTDKRAGVEPGQRLLDAAGGRGPDPLVDPSEIVSGGPPPDGIPPIDRPRFEGVAEVEWLSEREPVIVVVIDGDARAYPLQILTWHEIANDTVGGLPISVTFCPLCNTAYAFARPKVKGRVTSLGTSGMLYYSNLVMYDRATSSLWPQAMGKP